MISSVGVVGMAVGDQRALHRAHRIDKEIAGRAIEPFRAGLEQIAGTHG
jgi:hypothetical protein